MKKIFEEYGQTILAIIVGVALLGFILGGAKFYQMMNEAMDTDTDTVHTGTDEALKWFSEREKPKISIASADKLRLYADEVFKPAAAVKCVDADGETLDAEVVDIVFVDGIDGSQVEVYEHYDSETDTLDIPSAIGKTGALTVTYKTTDKNKLVAKKTISFVVDVAAP